MTTIQEPVSPAALIGISELEFGGKPITEWFSELMDDGLIEVCPRCCVNLTADYFTIGEYMANCEIIGGAFDKFTLLLNETLGINNGYWLYADALHQADEGNKFYLCAHCAEGGVSIYEDSENWPIEGRFPESLTRS